MGTGPLMLCSFLVLLAAVSRCQGSRSDVRQQLRSEIVYSERNHKEGRYKYGYAVKKGETQFHHQRSLDGAMYGCYGYVDPQGKLFITHYLADMAGYRLVNMANPDRKLAERIRNLGTAENPVDLQHLFPVECREDGDIKTLQETADAMKASLAEAGDQTVSYGLRSSSHSVSTGSQDATVEGSFTSSNGATGNSAKLQTSQTVRSSGDQTKSFESRSISQQGSFGQDAKFKEEGSVVRSQTSDTSSNQQSNVQQSSANRESIAISYKTNVNKESSLGRTSVRTLVSAEPKFVMKSKESSIRIAASTSSGVGASTNVAQNKEQSAEYGTKTAIGADSNQHPTTGEADQSMQVVRNVESLVEKQISENQQTIASKVTKLSSNIVAGTATQAAYDKDGNKQKITEENGSGEVQRISVKTSVDAESGKKFGTLNSDNKQQATISVNIMTGETAKASQEDTNLKITEHRTVTTKGTVESLKNSKTSESSKLEAKQQSFGTASIGITAEESVKISQSSSSAVRGNINNQDTEIGVAGVTSGHQQMSEESSKESGTKTINDDQQTSKTLQSLKTSTMGTSVRTDAAVKTVTSEVSTETSEMSAQSVKNAAITAAVAAKNTASVGESTDDQSAVKTVASGVSTGTSEITAGSTKITANTLAVVAKNAASVEESTEERLAGTLIRKGAKIGLLGEEEQVDSVDQAERDQAVREDSMGVKILNKEFLGVQEHRDVTESKQDTEDSTDIADATVKANSVKEDTTTSVSSGFSGSAQGTHSTKTKYKVGTETLTSRAGVATSTTKAKESSASVVRKSEQKANEGAKKSTVDGFHIKGVSKVNEESKAASRMDANVKEQLVKAGPTIQDVNNYEGINLRFDDEESTSLTASDASASSSATGDRGSTSTGRASSAVYRGSVKYADYASGRNQLSDQTSRGINGVRQTELELSMGQNVAKNLRGATNVKQEYADKSKEAVEQKSQVSEARVQQRSQVQKEASVESSVVKSLLGGDQSKEINGIKTVEVQRKSQVSEVRVNKQGTPAQQAALNLRDGLSVKQEVVAQNRDMAVKTGEQKNQVSESRIQQGTQMTSEQNVAKNRLGGSTIQQEGTSTNNKKGAVKIADYIKDSTVEGASQAESVMQSNDMSTKQGETSSQESKRTKEEGSIVEKESSSSAGQLKQVFKQSEGNSGRSFNQVKQEQQSSIIRFAIPGIIQQGPPIQGRRSFVAIPNLNNLFPTNSQSRVGPVPTADEDNSRLEGPRLPATPRTTTPASPEAASVSYPNFLSVTDRIPVTPRPTTSGFRPFTPGTPSTTAKSLLSRTTVGPNGDIYDEIEEELELGVRPTLMSPQIPEQKPTTSGGAVSVIPSIGQGVVVEQQSGSSHCYEVTLQVPADARQIFVRTNAPEFRVHGDGDPNERIRLVEPGVYEVNLGATSGIQFNRYQTSEDPWKRSNKLRLDVDRNFDYGELVQKPLFSRTQSSTTVDQQARLNNPYLPLGPAAPVEAARNMELESAEQVLTPEQRSLLSLVPSWKKVRLYY